jgi:hypothetical protein
MSDEVIMTSAPYVRSEYIEHLKKVATRDELIEHLQWVWNNLIAVQRQGRG